MFKFNNKNTKTKCEIYVVLVSLLLTLNIFHTLFQCFYCYLWAGKCRLGKPLVYCSLTGFENAVSLVRFILNKIIGQTKQIPLMNVMNWWWVIVLACISIFKASIRVKRNLSVSYNPRHEYLKTSYVKWLTIFAMRFMVIGEGCDLLKGKHFVKYRFSSIIWCLTVVSYNQIELNCD